MGKESIEREIEEPFEAVVTSHTISFHIYEYRRLEASVLGLEFLQAPWSLLMDLLILLGVVETTHHFEKVFRRVLIQRS